MPAASRIKFGWSTRGSVVAASAGQWRCQGNPAFWDLHGMSSPLWVMVASQTLVWVSPGSPRRGQGQWCQSRDPLVAPRGNRAWNRALPRPCPAFALSPFLLESKTKIKGINQQSSAYWPLSPTSPLISSLIRLSSKTQFSPRLGFTRLQVLLEAHPSACAVPKLPLSCPWPGITLSLGQSGGAGAQDILQAGETEAQGNYLLWAAQGGLGSFTGLVMLWLLHPSSASVPGSGTEQPDPKKTALCHPSGRLPWVPGSERGFQSCLGH